ncbi:ShlB/FhaC/HecB family hemolysin secretion/activation protein [Sphingomonas rubra]|uniref:Hemolysin activation/secretion protein n=1 Tax=Sphingomonas rubra TaxID=634430 RepID=A0A1I5RI06_9SPHN|nr:ShlB/FhaC/HecB family hemolysin secretion/activation protein [Sphingomonas rubra]SFP57957.1 Hemolysin activation/secretion protein [Sphingomonas rubra]
MSLASPAGAQVILDRADPTITEQALPRPNLERPEVARPSQVAVDDAVVAGDATRTAMVTAVTVAGVDGVDASAYAAVIAPVVGRELDRAELGRFATAIAGVVRARGYPFATASIGAQAMTGGVLRVTVDPGKIDAVRVIGARNTAADAILVRALTGGRPVTQAALERALLLVGDLPGVRVKETRYAVQDGFGILLVTIDQDRASAYAQVDNRGSDEVGPVRSTVLGSLRNLAGDGDELGLIVAQTPLQPSEFAFVRARYSAPVDAGGAVLSVSGSLGRSNPGAALRALDVVGDSGDLAVTYARPLHRRRSASLWAGAEFRVVSVEQTLSGQLLRRDRLATLTGSLSGLSTLAGGVFHGELSTAVGLPFAGATREGDPRISRPDGDGHFVTGTFQVDWTARITKSVSIVLASAGQLASRPLLATAEIGLGGPGFGRAYDYAERTGDIGIMGSAELRADTGGILRGVIDRTQFYGFVDGGTVDNLRDGFGGGTLASTGVGLRAGTGKLDGMVEIALPLNQDRFDTGDRRPRISLRVSRTF